VGWSALSSCREIVVIYFLSLSAQLFFIGVTEEVINGIGSGVVELGTGFQQGWQLGGAQALAGIMVAAPRGSIEAGQLQG
jgi:hypothetical protein